MMLLHGVYLYVAQIIMQIMPSELKRKGTPQKNVLVNLAKGSYEDRRSVENKASLSRKPVWGRTEEL